MYHRQHLLKAWARRGRGITGNFWMKTKRERGRLQDASAEPVQAYYTSTFSKGQRIKTSSCGPKCHKIRKIFSNAHITLLPTSSLFFFCSPPADVHSLPLQKITTYMSTFLEVDNWTEAHYHALKPCMELYFLLLILLLVPTLISGFKKYEYCKIEQEKRCQSKWCLQQQEFMIHGTHFILSFFGETYCISPLS